MNILVTGCAGFIGFHTSLKLIESQNNKIFGIDNLNAYYDINLKKDRLKKLKKNKNFFFKKLDICKKKSLDNLFKQHKFKIVINLAAQAGVRYSILDPDTYFKNNILGFYNILDISRLYKINHFIFASSSSVYGNIKKFPIKEEYNTDFPQSFYAASKKSNEVIAFSYSSIYNMPITGLRFFTVYGPYGRPDMSLFKFTKAMLNNVKLQLFNNGNHVRDFTYIDDVVESIIKISKKRPKTSIPYSIFNIGSSNPQKLMKFLKVISSNLNIEPKIQYKSMQKGDVYKTHANVNKLFKEIKFKPKTPINVGIKSFIKWYKDYYKKN
jgi:UDP-glucuronate 4-epimerase